MFIIPKCTMSQNFIKLITINIFKKFKTKNAKNHAISLLQMQGFPQSNAKKENKNFHFKDS